MVDVGTGLTVLGSAVGSRELIARILGPTADYLGNEAKAWTEQRLNNLAAIFRNAQKKLGNKIENQGAVPPKVLRSILDDGSYCDNELAADYFGGVLASSRTGNGRDDRGASYSLLIARLSTYQIRSHFYLYSVIRDLYRGVTDNIGIDAGRRRLRTFVPFESYMRGMEFQQTDNVQTITSHVMFGLSREALIESDFFFGAKQQIVGLYAAADCDGLLFNPSALGVELYLWAHGRGDLTVNDFLRQDIELSSSVTVNVVGKFRSVADINRILEKT